MSEAVQAELEITLGVGRRSPRGRRVRIPAGELASVLEGHSPDRPEAWWSVHTWEGDHRGKERWEGASGICLDIDYHNDGHLHEALPGSVANALTEAVEKGSLPGSLFHLTPRGARVVFVFQSQNRDPLLQERATEGAIALLLQALGEMSLLAPRDEEGKFIRTVAMKNGKPVRTFIGPGLVLDPSSEKNAQFMFSPGAIVEGEKREDELRPLQDAPFLVEGLAALAPPPPAPRDILERAQAQAARPQGGRGAPPRESLDDIAKRWNEANQTDWGKHQPCPACEGRESFSGIPGSHRWACHHASHNEPGRLAPDGSCYTGDALDLEAWRRGCKPVDVLREDGFLPISPVRGQAPHGQPLADVHSIDPLDGPLEITKSFASLCAILRRDKRIISERLGWDTLAGMPTIGGKQITDTTALQIREKIELLVQDSKNNGLKFSRDEIDQALDLVASEDEYSPVVEYLETLTWDGVDRLEHVPEDYLGADGTEINRVMFKKWAISAVARAMDPGCQVDTVLILQGKQGARKSGFFKELVGEDWYTSAALDIEKKERNAAMMLHRVWVLEWGELGSLQRARDQDAIKEFITRRIDTLLLPYGRRIVRMPRHSVIVGSTNDDDFLADPTGSRRYWVIPTADDFDLAPITALRDQFWAEAVHRFRAKEQWWLTDREKALLQDVHDRFRRRDSWEEIILPWLEGQSGPRTSADILEMAIQKPAGQWTTADARRVSAILRGAGYTQQKTHRTRVWVREEDQ